MNIFHNMKFYKKKRISKYVNVSKNFFQKDKNFETHVNNVIEVIGHQEGLYLYFKDNNINIITFNWFPNLNSDDGIIIISNYFNRDIIPLDIVRRVLNDKYIYESKDFPFYYDKIYVEKVGKYLLISDKNKRAFILPCKIFLDLINDKVINIEDYVYNSKFSKCHYLAYSDMRNLDIQTIDKYYCGCFNYNNVGSIELEKMNEFLEGLLQYDNKTYLYLSLGSKFDKYLKIYICNFV